MFFIFHFYIRRVLLVLYGRGIVHEEWEVDESSLGLQVQVKREMTTLTLYFMAVLFPGRTNVFIFFCFLPRVVHRLTPHVEFIVDHCRLHHHHRPSAFHFIKFSLRWDVGLCTQRLLNVAALFRMSHTQGSHRIIVNAWKVHYPRIELVTEAGAESQSKRKLRTLTTVAMTLE